MHASPQRLDATLANLAPEWPEDLQPSIRRAIRERPEKIVVLDDDPTGNQTMHDVPVLTEWSVPILQRELENDLPICFILTNTRSLPLPAAQAINAQVGHRLREAAQHVSKRVVVISRSDSTLRGHFPGEVDSLLEALGRPVDGWLLIPFFQEGGRYTINDTHYVTEGEHLVPAGETEFARDAAFGYRNSDLRLWVEEKTDGRMPANRVLSVSIDDIRRGGPEQVAAKLMTLANGQVCIVNAASRRDLEVLTLGVLHAEAQGKQFIYRTAASILPVRAGNPPRELLTAVETVTPQPGGGLTVVGSHVPRTSSQLECLLQLPGLLQVEIDVRKLLSDTQRAAVITGTTQAIEAGLRAGQDVVVYTSRELIAGDDAGTSLSIGQRVSDGLVSMIQNLATAPRYILAKGGITSSDLATQSLGVRRALVLGQILPGVSVWQLGPETRFPGLSYIVFPGNVGGPDAVADVVRMLRR